jgi:hypothetical protein
LREAGIENIRILTTNTGNKLQNPKNATIDILLYK